MSSVELAYTALALLVALCVAILFLARSFGKWAEEAHRNTEALRRAAHTNAEAVLANHELMRAFEQWSQKSHDDPETDCA